MSLEDFKNIAESVQAIVTIGAIAVGGWWAYRKFVRQREDSAKIQFSLNANLICPLKDQWIVEIIAVLENKGLVRHEIDASSFDFHIRYLTEMDKLENIYTAKNEANFALSFKRKLTIENESDFLWLPKHWKYTFIDPGVVQEYRRSLVLPSDCICLLINSKFLFRKSNQGEFQTAAITVHVPPIVRL